MGTALLLAAGLLAACGLEAQEADFSKIEMKVSKVAGNVYVLQGVGEPLERQWATMGLCSSMTSLLRSRIRFRQRFGGSPTSQCASSSTRIGTGTFHQTHLACRRST